MRRSFFIERFFDRSANICAGPTRKYLDADDDTALPQHLISGEVIRYYFVAA
jgi:hypothetical protein